MAREVHAFNKYNEAIEEGVYGGGMAAFNRQNMNDHYVKSSKSK